MDMMQMVASQTEIIRLQSEIIDGLFVRLAQNIPAEELYAMPEIEKIDKAVRMRQAICDDIDGLEEAER